jgi:hypothetical protein
MVRVGREKVGRVIRSNWTSPEALERLLAELMRVSPPANWAVAARGLELGEAREFFEALREAHRH